MRCSAERCAAPLPAASACFALFCALLSFAESKIPDDRVARIVLQSTADDDAEREEIFTELRDGSVSIRIKYWLALLCYAGGGLENQLFATTRHLAEHSSEAGAEEE